MSSKYLKLMNNYNKNGYATNDRNMPDNTVGEGTPAAAEAEEKSANCDDSSLEKKEVKQVVTYGARGLLEFHMTIHTGGVRLKIPFEGGSMCHGGIYCATFTTDNAALQHLIEDSPEFRKKRIYKVR